MRARWFLHRVRTSSLQSSNHKMWKPGSYIRLPPILPPREEETLSLLCNISTLWRREGEISIFTPVSRKGELSKLYYPGMSLCTNTFNLAVNTFVQRTWAVHKYKIFTENCLPKTRLCLVNGMFSPLISNNS